MRITSLGSGSSGNAFLVEAGPARRTKLLIDAGLPGQVLLAHLRRFGIHPAQLTGILLTHEHSDHVIGLPALLKYNSPGIFASPGTLATVAQLSFRDNASPDGMLLFSTPAARTGEPVSRIRDDLLHPLDIGASVSIGDIAVLPFRVSHDAAEPCGYLLRAGGCRIAVVIDSGEVTAAMMEAMHHADLLILESNHDREKLLRGPYPHYLKQRILSPTGHLSNDQAAEAVLRTWPADSVRWLWLSHLSRTNNTPTLALQSMIAHLTAAGANLSHIHISVLPPGLGRTWDSTRMWHEPSLWEWRE